MVIEIRQQLMRELESRGYKDGVSPNGSMTLDHEYLSAVGIGELLVQMVARREKLSRSTDVVGSAVARAAYDDVAAAVEAIRVVVDQMILP